MSGLPTGTVTFLYTDIEGSTRRWEQYPAAMRPALQQHDAILRQAIENAGGVVFRTMGDAFCAAFHTAPQGIDAAVAAQRALLAEAWPEQIGAIRVRMALHTGIGEVGGGDYTGPTLNRIARLLSTGYGGQVLVSQSTRDLMRDALPEGIGLKDLGEHRLKDLQLPEHIFQVTAQGLPNGFPPILSLDNHPNNLPMQRSPLVGREQELAAVQSLLLRRDVGLLTLTGPGGIGKTRLALQAAAEVIDHFSDGVFFVSLASVSDPEMVAPAIAQVLGIKEMSSQEMVNNLVGYLRDKQMLLVLDNFEQVVEAAPVVARLLDSARDLRVLVTSREVLRLHGEQEFLVPSLDLPDLRRLPPLESLAQYEAVALFVQRARLVRPDFALTVQNAGAVVEICQRLDGLPLAIELAAARIRLLTPQAMLARLASRFDLLTGGGRDLPERQQTLHNAMQWSYDLLQAPEQQLFRRISVFVGGCTLEAIEEVCNSGGDLEVDVFNAVASLVDKSLLRQEMGAGDEARIGMLRTVREFADGVLRLEGEEAIERLRRCHAEYYLAQVSKIRDEFRGALKPATLDNLEQEHDNARAAIDWAVEHGEKELALRLVGALWLFWNVRGFYREALKSILAALSLTEPAERTVDRADGLVAAAMMYWRLDDYNASESYAAQAINILREIRQKGERNRRVTETLGYALIQLGAMSAAMTRDNTGDPIFDEAVELFKEVGDQWGLAVGYIDKGLAANARNEPEIARAAFEQCLALFQKVGDLWGVAQGFNGLGDVARIQGNYEEAGQNYERALELYKKVNVRADIPAGLHNLGYVALARGDTRQAESLFTEALDQHAMFENQYGMAEDLAGLAALAAAQHKPEQSAKLYGAVDAFRKERNVIAWPAERVENDRHIPIARAQIDDEAWQNAWNAGAAMTIEEAAAYALQANPVSHHRDAENGEHEKEGIT